MISERLYEIGLVALVAVIVLVFVVAEAKVFTREARELTLKANLHKIRTAIEFYYARTNTFPETIEQGISKGFGNNVTLVLQNTDAKGRARDPFGRRYHYNPATGEVRSRTSGCDKY